MSGKGATTVLERIDQQIKMTWSFIIIVSLVSTFFIVFVNVVEFESLQVNGQPQPVSVWVMDRLFRSTLVCPNYDLNQDGVVDLEDTLLIMDAFDGGDISTGDLDGDNDVDEADIQIVVDNFGAVTCTEVPVCGDGVIDTGEVCDDSNTLSGDGCSSICSLETDADMDGYYLEVNDCDDNNANINPGMSESYNSIDDDCDGQIDENLCVPSSSNPLGAVVGTTEVCGLEFSGIGICTGPGTRVCQASGWSSCAWTQFIGPAAEICGDGIDQDCNGADMSCPLTDIDSDGYLSDVDCNDNDASINPGATEICGNGVDENCDGVSETCPLTDADSDSYFLEVDDCNDNDASINPGATDICGDGIDQDCSGADAICIPADADADGYDENIDCNDNDASINPGATDICGDGIDQDCSGADLACPLTDADSDSYFLEVDDCNDNDASINPGVNEICDSLDNNCDGQIDENDICSAGSFCGDGTLDTGEVCDDGNSVNFDGCSDACLVEVDDDIDGFYVGEDCNDNDASINPDASEICGDGIDQDCSGADLVCTVEVDVDGFGGATTDLTGKDLSNLVDLVLETAYGKIEYVAPTSIPSGTRIADYVAIEDKRMSVDEVALSGLNKQARLYFYNINFQQPKIRWNGADCVSPRCTDSSYANGIYEVLVSGFSEYTLVEGEPSSSSGGGSSGGSSGGGSSSGGGGGSSTVTPPQTQEPLTSTTDTSTAEGETLVQTSNLEGSESSLQEGRGNTFLGVALILLIIASAGAIIWTLILRYIAGDNSSKSSKHKHNLF